jgi:hypothetical protein
MNYRFRVEKLLDDDPKHGFVLVHCSDWPTFEVLTKSRKMLPKRSQAFAAVDDSDPILLNAIKSCVPGSVTAHIDEVLPALLYFFQIIIFMGGGG